MKNSVSPSIRSDDEFPALLISVEEWFGAFAEGPFYQTDAVDLFPLFFAGLPDELRQTYTCHCCRRFFETYGGLVAIHEDGSQVPAIFPPDAPAPFRAALAPVLRAVSRAKVTGVFLSSSPIWGTPVTGFWSHLAVAPANSAVYRGTLLSAGQKMAEKAEERAMLLRGLAEFSRETVAKAIPLLESDSLYRSEKCLGVAKWLLALHDARTAQKRKDRRENLVWQAVATAPPGWAHVRSTMIGTLLEDIASGMDFGTLSRRFREKMSPLQYQRPQAPPTAGNLAQAEKVVAALGSAGSLARRFATLDDIEKLWVPKIPTAPPKPESVFGHLKVNGIYRPETTLDPPAVAVTWEKFARDILPKAEKIEYRVPSFGPFIALLTAVNPDSPPILQWDSGEHRNPVSWYVYSGGSHAHSWKLTAGEWAKVTAVTLFPHQWHGTHEQHGKGAIFVLDGAVDTRDTGNGLFPEILKSEYREIRASLEAYSRHAPVEGRENASACGVDIRAWGQVFRVTAGPSRLSYKIDRWD